MRNVPGLGVFLIMQNFSWKSTWSKNLSKTGILPALVVIADHIDNFLDANHGDLMVNMNWGNKGRIQAVRFHSLLRIFEDHHRALGVWGKV